MDGFSVLSYLILFSIGPIWRYRNLKVVKYWDPKQNDEMNPLWSYQLPSIQVSVYLNNYYISTLVLLVTLLTWLYILSQSETIFSILFKPLIPRSFVSVRRNFDSSKGDTKVPQNTSTVS